MPVNEARGYVSMPFPWLRVPIVDSLRAARAKPLMHALIEVDVTAPRVRLAEWKERTGESLSFTAFIIGCVARAVAEEPVMQALRKGTRRLVVFDAVDICTPIEHGISDERQSTPYMIRGADRRSLIELHREIRSAQVAGLGDPRALRLRRLYPRLPSTVRGAFWWAFNRFPLLKRRIGGSVMVTAVGMFGKGGGWGISPTSEYTLQVVIGGIGEKLALVNGRVEAREMLCLTVSADHDIVDGGPMARFVARLDGLIAGGYGLVAVGVAAPGASEELASSRG